MRSFMQPRFAIVMLLMLILFAACQSSQPTEYRIEVTREVTVVVVVTATPEGSEPVAPTETTPSSTPTDVPTATPTIVLTPTMTPTLDPFPTPINEQIIVAEQLFERGRMFYLQPNQKIWVMVEGADTNSGQWIIYDDSWLEGMQEFDPDIVPPEGLFQPERGFGKLWRDNDSVQDLLGWAVDTEYGHVTTYEYFAGGSVTPEGVYVQGPGYHTLISRYGGTYMFDEASGTWRRAPGT